jgi:hypothetical protein
MFCFYTPASTGRGFVSRYMFMVMCVVPYPLSVRRNFVVCRHVSLTNQGVLGLENVCGTLACPEVVQNLLNR